ncbi:conserved hypothetical protein [Coccidioides posadasii str. Silveira]|uniref:Uncharacterized protein n=1 Tax=Coccidioides posadasii (strain RMSCC 757 / Silveira) TaxID=443226 RepID=E9DJM8_COCPS|nr:conserved hypothetical protein [Coccidioides posadasii str. Silveira]
MVRANSPPQSALAPEIATLEEIPAVMLMVDTCASGEEKPVCVNCQRQGDTCVLQHQAELGGAREEEIGKNVVDGNASASSPSRRPTAEGVQPNRLVNDKLWGDGVRHASPTENGKSNHSLMPAFSAHHRRHHHLPPRTTTTYPQSASNYTTANSYPSPASVVFPRDDSSTLPQVQLSPYPSPSDSAVASPGISPFQPTSTSPPFTFLQTTLSSPPVYPRRALTGESHRDAKRIKISPQGFQDLDVMSPGSYSQPGSGPRDSSNTPGGTLFSSTDSSDTTSEEAYPPHQQVLGHQDASARPELQRVSVQSLLSHSIADGALPPSADICPTTRENSASVIVTGSSETAVSFGFDCGRVDLDINRNDDSAAIEYKIATLQLACPVTSPTMTSSSTDSERDTKKRVTALFTKGGYYARPRVKFPHPSPPKLDHTRRAVSNSEDTVAVQDTNLLNLLLAYSASHRARLLGHAEPYNRIAHWTRHVFPKLRHALDDPNEKISDTNLATAIMLASLKIISPSTFEVPIPWESHLKLARGLFLARRQMQVKYSSDQVEFFLCRWLGYLDILGSLSSRQTEPPLLGGNYWSTVALDEPRNPGSDLEIDCFTGFTLECRSFFVRLAELIHECDVCQVDPVTGRPISAWTPPPLILTRAERLLFDMTSSRSRNYHHRTHHGLPELGDMAALDDSYRLTGIVQLYRRVFCLSASDTKVVESINMLIDSLDRVSRGGATEVCALLPLFTAGCETRDTTQRQAIRARFKGFEGVGMKQIRRARKLMQRSWQENLPWTMLANAFEDKAIPIIKHRGADQACRRGFDVQCACNIQ